MGFYRKISTFFKPYKPKEYWEKRGQVYKKEYEYSESSKRQEKVLVEYLKSLSFDSVLEFGCGFGRITKIVLENFPIKKYVALDLSADQLLNAKNLCKEFDNVTFVQSTIQDFNPDEKFDIVLGIEVLLHVLPDEINDVIRKLVNHTNKHLVHVDWYENTPPKIRSPHNFIHNYKKIYENIKSISEVKTQPVSGKQILFHAKITS